MLTRSGHFLSSGFTLTVLLVVIVTIATIFALPPPGISRMRDMADKTRAVCSLSRLSEIDVTKGGARNALWKPDR